MGYYSPCFFSETCYFLKVAITKKILVGISSNFLQSISTSICIRKLIKIGGDLVKYKPKNLFIATEVLHFHSHTEYFIPILNISFPYLYSHTQSDMERLIGRQLERYYKKE